MELVLNCVADYCIDVGCALCNCIAGFEGFSRQVEKWGESIGG